MEKIKTVDAEDLFVDAKLCSPNGIFSCFGDKLLIIGSTKTNIFSISRSHSYVANSKTTVDNPVFDKIFCLQASTDAGKIVIEEARPKFRYRVEETWGKKRRKKKTKDKWITVQSFCIGDVTIMPAVPITPIGRKKILGIRLDYDDLKDELSRIITEERKTRRKAGRCRCGKHTDLQKANVCQSCAASSPDRCITCGVFTETVPIHEFVDVSKCQKMDKDKAIAELKHHYNVHCGNPFADYIRERPYPECDKSLWTLVPNWCAPELCRDVWMCVSCAQKLMPLKEYNRGYRQEDSIFFNTVTCRLVPEFSSLYEHQWPNMLDEWRCEKDDAKQRAMKTFIQQHMP